MNRPATQRKRSEPRAGVLAGRRGPNPRTFGARRSPATLDDLRDRVRAIAAIGATLGCGAAPGGVAEEVAGLALGIFAVDTAAVLAPAPAGWELLAVAGEPACAPETFASAVARAVADASLVLSSASDPEGFQDLTGAAAGSWAAVPLHVAGERVGLVVLGDDDPLRFEDPIELELAGLFASQAAAALHARRPDAGSPGPDDIRNVTAMVVHELKTPLTTLLGYSAMLRLKADTIGGEQRDQFLDIMQRQGERILSLIDGLLRSLRTEAGLWKLPRERIDVQAVVRDAVADVGAGLGGRQIVVEVPEHELGVFGDAASIEQVLTNLLENAIKHSPPEGTIVVRVSEHEGEIHLSVSDEGRGIPDDELPHVFERFRQGSGELRGRASVGLGLYIARGLVAAHGGRIWADSDPGAGATFSFALPRRTADASGSQSTPNRRAGFSISPPR